MLVPLVTGDMSDCTDLTLVGGAWIGLVAYCHSGGQVMKIFVQTWDLVTVNVVVKVR